MSDLQLTFDGEGLDPHLLAEMLAPERGRLYAQLGLNDLQIACAEEAVRRVRLREYGRVTR